MRFIKRLSLKLAAQVLVTFGVTLLSSALWLINTESGSRWLLKTLVAETPQISVADINGTIAQSLHLKQVKYQPDKNFSVLISELTLHWQLAELLMGHLHIASLSVSDVLIKGQPAKNNKSKESQQAIPNIPLSISVDEFNLTHLNWLNGEQTVELKLLSGAATLQDNQLSLSRLELLMPQLKASANAEMTLNAELGFKGQVDWVYRLGDQPIKGQLNLSGTKQQVRFNNQMTGVLVAQQGGVIDLSKGEPKLSVTGHWKKLHWPLSGKPQFSSLRGEFAVLGQLNDYQSSLNADVMAATDSLNIGFVVDLIAKGNRQGLKIERLELKPEQGVLQAEGEINWGQILGGEFNVTAKDFNPAMLGSNVAGNLAIKAHIKAKLENNKIQADLQLKKLSGTLHQQPVSAVAKIKVDNQQVAVDSLKLIAGKNQLTAQGQISAQQADFNVSIIAPDLASAWPSLSGTLNATASIKGSLQRPTVRAELEASHLNYQESHITQLFFNTDYQHASQQQSTLELSAYGVKVQQHEIEHFNLQVNGNQQAHKILLDLQSSLADLHLRVDGRWDQPQWIAQVNELWIEKIQFKKWQLAEPTQLVLQPHKQQSQFELANSCLVQASARVCVFAKGELERAYEANFDLSEVPLTLAQHWLPEGLSLLGALSAKGQLSFFNEALSANINANIVDGLVRVGENDSVQHELRFKTPKLQFEYADDQLISQIQISTAETDFITANIYADRANVKGVRLLSGAINAKVADMSLLDSFVADIEKLQGVFIADLALSGNTDKPVITGLAQWENGQFDVPRLGNSFKNIQLQVKSADEQAQRLLLNLAVNSGSGILTGVGHLDLLPQQQFPLQLHLKGEHFQLAQLPEAEVIISPDVQVSKQGMVSKIEGVLKIDKAEIALQSLPETAVSLSEDEVIISKQKNTVKKQSSQQLQTNLNIQFGEKTHFVGFGLDTYLMGNLDYIATQDKQQMQGQAAMKKATYRSYGQDLTIRKGKFIFNGPVNNPRLNIEAIRKASKDDVTAVLKVTGPLKSPTTQVYTEPSLPESEALAYLVTGKSLKNTNKSEGNAVANAAFSYGLGQLSWLSDQLGIDEFEVESGDNIEDSALRLGQYLNPDLYVGVTMSLFSNQHVANIRYQLSKHFSINTRAGETQRVDLKYHLQSD